MYIFIYIYMKKDDLGINRRHKTPTPVCLDLIENSAKREVITQSAMPRLHYCAREKTFPRGQAVHTFTKCNVDEIKIRSQNDISRAVISV